MKTEQEFQEKSQVLVEPINTFIAENKWQWGIPSKSSMAWDRQEQQVIVHLEYEVGTLQWTAKTIEEMKNYIMADILNLVEL